LGFLADSRKVQGVDVKNGTHLQVSPIHHSNASREWREKYHCHVICDINIVFILEIAERISEPHHIHIVIKDAVPEVQKLQQVLGST